MANHELVLLRVLDVFVVELAEVMAEVSVLLAPESKQVVDFDEEVVGDEGVTVVLGAIVVGKEG